MKVGDKLICKKPSEYIRKNQTATIFEMGEKYCILDYDDDPIASFSFYFIKDDRLKYIWDYFYSPEEIRLLKLKSL